MPILAKVEVFIVDARGWHTTRPECTLEMLYHPPWAAHIYLPLFLKVCLILKTFALSCRVLVRRCHSKIFMTQSKESERRRREQAMMMEIKHSLRPA